MHFYGYGNDSHVPSSAGISLKEDPMGTTAFSREMEAWNNWNYSFLIKQTSVWDLTHNLKAEAMWRDNIQKTWTQSCHITYDQYIMALIIISSGSVD